MIELTIWLVFTLVEFIASFAIPAYISLKLVSKTVKTGEAKDVEQYKLWSFYWIMLLVIWELFAYLDFIPYLFVLRAAFAVALVYPKVNLHAKIYAQLKCDDLQSLCKSVLSSCPFKDSAEKVKEFEAQSPKKATE